jgi:hypothetical protein
MAAPGLPITKGPVQPDPSWTGPLVDPHARQGQWFRRAATGVEEPRPYELYDNVYGYGGSQWKGALAIEGYVTGLNFDGQGNITGFNIFSRIWNDMPGEGTWADGANAHGESLHTTQQYYGTMRGVKLTTSFADDGILGNFPGPAGPYTGSETSQNIYGINYDQLAWYCWTPGHGTPAGSYMVPTWDFPDIPPGGVVTRNLPFGLYNPVGPGSALYQFLLNAEQQQPDIFLNRTTSLKISDYFDALAIDTGVPYPVPPSRSSDVSVFFFPEPASFLLTAVAGLLLRRR